MLKGSTWLTFIILNVVFILMIVRVYIAAAILSIKAEWPKHRCNPMFMPFSDDIATDFTFCVQKVQTGYMSFLLQPLNYLIGSLDTISGKFNMDILNIRKMFDWIRSQISTIVQSIFSIAMALITEFQRITISTKDLFMKMMGITEVMMNMVQGSIKTGQSTWNGPAGEMVRGLGSVCFHPNTHVKLCNGEIKRMQHVELGDVLQGGSKVCAVMKLAPNGNDIYHRFANAGEGGKNIYVTGSHLVLNNSGKYVQVRSHSEAIACPEKEIKWLSCLITSDHKIRIGDMTFWDWDDDVHYQEKKNMNRRKQIVCKH